MKSSSLRIEPPPRPSETERGLFNQARTKLWWARRCAHSVSCSWEDWVKAFYERFPENANGPSTDAIPHKIFVTDHIALSIADCLHNLRGALDLAISDLARAAKLSDEVVVFPSGITREAVQAYFSKPASISSDLPDNGPGILYDLAFHYPNLSSIIIDDIQPFLAEKGLGAAGDTITRIIQLDDINRRQIIIPVAKTSLINNIRFSVDGEMTGGMVIMGGGSNLPPGVEVNGDPEFTVDMFFGKMTALAFRPITRTLQKGCDAVAEVIGIFEKNF